MLEDQNASKDHFVSMNERSQFRKTIGFIVYLGQQDLQWPMQILLAKVRSLSLSIYIYVYMLCKYMHGEYSVIIT